MQVHALRPVGIYGDYYPLPSNVTQFNDQMCGKWNRNGTLCGKCRENYYPLVYSFSMACMNCTEVNANVLKFICVAFVPLTLFYFFVLFFKISATSNLTSIASSYSVMLFPYQHLARVFMTFYSVQNPITVAATFFKALLTLYGIWNLDFFRAVIPDICLKISPLAALSLDYAVAVYPFFLTALSYVMIELHYRNFKIVVMIWKPFRYIFTLIRRNWDIRTSVIDAYATFFLLSFLKILSVTFDLLIPTYAYPLNASEPTLTVLYYDGTVEYFGPEHLPYAILAILISILFIILPTLLLLFYPFRFFQWLLNCCKINCYILTAFMDAFQGSYNDGTEPGTRDCRWFAALYLVLRISMLAAFALTLGPAFFPLETIILLLMVILIN